MRKAIIAPVLAVVLLLAPLTASAESSGFYGIAGYTETTNGYFFDYKNALLVDNKEIIDDFNYDEFHAGSTLYMPVGVYAGNAITGTRNDFTATAATDKMIKDDNVEVSSKVLMGGEHVGEIVLIDGKKEKIDGLPAGIYIKIPLVLHFENYDKDEIFIRFVLSVNGVGYHDTLINLSCYIINRLQYIDRVSVYATKHPTQFHVWPNFSGEVTFDFGDKIKYTNRVYGGDDYYFSLTREPDESIEKMYPDKKTYIEYFNFRGDEDAFTSTGTLELPVQRDKLSVKKGEPESLYVYRVEGGELISMDKDEVSFDGRKNMLTIETDSLEYYVLSNQALLPEIQDANDPNILKTGYAELEAPEELEELGELPLNDDSVPLPVNPDTDPLPLIEPAAALGVPTEITAADDDLAPEEDEFFGEDTDAPISAANMGSLQNPSTSDSSKTGIAVFIMVISLAAIIKYRLNKA